MYRNHFQEYIASLLEEYGALQKRQIQQMVNYEFNTHLPNIDGYVAQMCRYDEFDIISDDIVASKGVEVDYDIIRSFDVLLAFMPKVHHHRRSRDSVSIAFFIQTDTMDKEVYVVPVRDGAEHVICSYADDKFRSKISEVVIFLLDDKNQIKKMHAGCNHKLAIFDKNGVKFLERKK